MRHFERTAIRGSDLERDKLSFQSLLNVLRAHIQFNNEAYARVGQAEPRSPRWRLLYSSALESRARTLRSSRVVVSPLISLPDAICLRRRRMILPDRVFGRASAKRISSGFATGPISLATCWRNSSRKFPSAFTPPFTVTRATRA